MSREKKCTPRWRIEALPLEVAEQARAVHVVGLAREDRRDHHRELLGQVLAVGVERDDDLRVEVQRDVVADAEGQPAAAPDRQLGDERARLAGDARRCRRRSRRSPPPGPRGGPRPSPGIASITAATFSASLKAGETVTSRGPSGKRRGAVPVEPFLAERLDEQPDAPLVRVGGGLRAQVAGRRAPDGHQQGEDHAVWLPRWKLNVRRSGLNSGGYDRERDHRGAEREQDDQVQPADLPALVAADRRGRRTPSAASPARILIAGIR